MTKRIKDNCKSVVVSKTVKSSLPEENWKKFIDELVQISNKYRTVLVIEALLELRTEVVDGKLLDLAGYTRVDDTSNRMMPYFVDRMTKDSDSRCLE